MVQDTRLKRYLKSIMMKESPDYCKRGYFKAYEASQGNDANNALISRITDKIKGIGAYHGNKNIDNIIEMSVSEMDLFNSEYLKEDFKAYLNIVKDAKPQATHKIHLDLRNVRDMDASGISSILALNWLSNYHGFGDIKVKNCNDYIGRLLHISEVDTILNIEY